MPKRTGALETTEAVADATAAVVDATVGAGAEMVGVGAATAAEAVTAGEGVEVPGVNGYRAPSGDGAHRLSQTGI